MKEAIYLKIQGKKNKYGSNILCGTCAVTKTKPSTKADEVVLAIVLDIPDAIFKKPELQAVISIPNDSVSQPCIDAQVQDNIADTLSESLGVVVHVSAVEEVE